MTLAKRKSVALADGTEVFVGQLFIDDDGRYIRVRSITEDGHIQTDYLSGSEWHSWGSVTPKELTHREYIPIASIEEAQRIKSEVAAGLDTMIADEESAPESSEKALATVTTKEVAERLRSAIEVKKQRVEIAKRVIEAEMDSMKNKLSHLIGTMTEKIARIQRVIDVFELYLGVYEEIVQIQAGSAAPAKTVISFRQMFLWMDEEVGDTRTGRMGQRGIDFTRIEDFDSWLTMGRNLDRILPEPKGVVVLKPSRQSRSYSDNPLFDAMQQEKNNKAYILIRNGDNLYRVYTSTNMGDKLFPAQEFNASDEQDDDRWQRSKNEDVRFIYRRNAVILQGLFDRTEVLRPLPEGRINLFNPDSYQGVVEFIRDDEPSLGDGRLPFWDWHKQINSSLGAGSRVYVAGGSDNSSGYWSSKDYARHFLTYSSRDNYPPLPGWGVYQLSLTDEAVATKEIVPDGTSKGLDGVEKPMFRYEAVRKRLLRIKYNPGDEVGTSGWEWNPHKRKNLVSFTIDPASKWVINVDQIDLDDIDYYVNNRQGRKEYLRVLPLLWGIRDFVQAERAKEQDFVKLVAGRTGVDEAKVWAAVDWWKFKNKWKRSISDDDPKALRMIERKLKGIEEEEK